MQQKYLTRWQTIGVFFSAKIPKKIMKIFVAFGQYKDDRDPLVVIWNHVYQ